MPSVTFESRLPKPRTTPDVEGRVGTSPLSPRICQIAPPPPAPKVYRAAASDFMEDDGEPSEVITGRGESTVSQAEANVAAGRELTRLMKERLARTTARLAEEQNRAAKADPTVKTKITLDRGKAETDLFLRNHPEFHRCEENKQTLLDAVLTLTRGKEEGWSVALLENAHARVKDDLVTSDGRTNREVREDAASAARSRPRRADAVAQIATGPTAEQIEWQQAQAQRAADEKVIADWEALPLQTQKLYVKCNRKFADKYELAKQRISPRANLTIKALRRY